MFWQLKWLVALKRSSIAARVFFLSGFVLPAAAFADIAQSPLFISSAATPLMMMTMSRDEQLFNKAYPDYTDLDGDGVLDTTYQDKFDYSGYFDSNLCYTYSTANLRFKATVTATDQNSNGKAHECGTGANTTQWSGNFLNWLSMSRIDELRFVLYGGNRNTDTATQTILERANIPNDLHAWAKVYAGADINYYTPFTGVQSFCNASFDVGGAANSSASSSTSPPVLRHAPGMYSEWAATESRQCRWNASDTSNADLPARPSADYDFIVRVEVCDPASGAVRENFCQLYGTTSYKPVGLLQNYGEPTSSGGEPRMRFGLLTGSYSNPRSGGILRRNIGKLASSSDCSVATDEINLSDGTFCHQTDGTEGLVNTVRRFSINNNVENYSGGNWSDCGTYAINNRTSGNGHLNNPGDNNTTGTLYKCGAWGNPIAEMYAETLRYLSGSSATSDFTGGTDLTGLPNTAWKNPYGTTASGGLGNAYCANCNVLMLSSGLPSFDGDEVPNVDALGLSSATAIANATKDVGVLEGISGQYLAGRSLNYLAATQTGSTLVVGEAANTHEDLCESRTVDDLSKVRGLCPDIPAQEGSMLVAGLAYKARTQDLQPALSKPTTKKITANTYTVALAENLPKFNIPVSGGQITFTPLCQSNGSGTATATSTDWRSCFLGSINIGSKTSTFGAKYVYGRDLQSDASAGSFSIVWEDSQWGNDHDKDAVSMITYCVGSQCTLKTGTRNGTGTQYTSAYSGYDICWRSDSAVCGANGSPSVGSDEVLVRVENLSAYAGNAMLTGFAITGSDADGVFRSFLRPGSSNGSLLTDSEDPRNDWSRPQVFKFKRGTTPAKQLQNPLWYAAKYGGFVTLDATQPLTPQGQGQASWDKNNTGTPDAFFKVTDPSKLKSSLNAVFSDVLARTAAASSVATNSTRIEGDTAIYQARFTSANWTGELLAYKLNEEDGSIGSLLWNASAASNIPAEGSRNLFTYNPTNAVGNRGVALAWGNLSAAEQAALRVSGEPDNTNAQKRLTWLRGGQSDEQPAGSLRKRTSVFGDIVNSDPVFSGALNFRYDQLLDTSVPGQSTYAAYVAIKAARTPVVFVGANDGFLHAINAKTGAELFAYMPSSVFAKAAALTAPNYGSSANPHQYYVDGPSFVGDVYINGGWRTVLVGTTGGGGKSIFALDVTNPTSFTAADVLFELNASDYPEIGNVLGQPLISRTANGKWSVIFGNGYNSIATQAYLFVVDLESPSSVVKIAAGSAGSNGLSAPSLLNSVGTTNLAYAGDLRGNMWKFDLSASNTNAWKVAYGTSPSPLPLFVARGPSGEVQPITSAPSLGLNPQRGNKLMVYFGTGQYFASNDNVVPATPPVQTMYGILDVAEITVTDRSVLHQKTISGQTATGRTVSEGTIDWSSVSGWYLDLLDAGTTTGTGERVISKTLLLFDRVVFVTFIPSQVTCSFGGSGWLMEVGGVGDSRSTTSMLGGSGQYLDVAVLKLSNYIKGGAILYLPLSDTGGDPHIIKLPPPPKYNGRMSWRQLR